ncbi:MAG: TatD family hydrolase, partial [Alphaproteobacteria bacterium]|nr:TatD family hydrolase [Alphaproteobacteria bacterium]
VDSHCHLTVSRFVDHPKNEENDKSFIEKYSVDSIVKRANAANVKYMLAIGTELSDVDEIREISESYKNVFRSVGIHPIEAQKTLMAFTQDEIVNTIKNHSELSKTIAIGEIGLDYHFEKNSEFQQKQLFRLQLELAKECKLPVSIHSRDAITDTISILEDYPGVQGVIHCFSGEKDFARRSLDLGFYISISGVVTFKNANELRESLKFIPLDRLLIETDAPFLAPVPFRGKINEPAFVVYTATKIAEILNNNIEEIAQITTENFFKLFNKACR